MSAAPVEPPSPETTASSSEALGLLLGVLVASLPGVFMGVLASAMKVSRERTTLGNMVRTSIVCTCCGAVAALVLRTGMEKVNMPLYLGTIFLLSFCSDYVLDLLPSLLPAVVKRVFNIDLAKLRKGSKPGRKAE